jgi:hypothetical protein
MSSNKKEKIHGGRVLIGVLLVVGSLWKANNLVQETELVVKTIIVSQPIKPLSSRSGGYEYRIQAKEYACSFGIKTAGAIAAHWHPLESITANDTLEIKIRESRLKDLEDKAENVAVYSLRKNGTLFFDVTDYNHEQKLLNRRWETIGSVAGVLLILRGLILVSSGFAWVVGIVAVVAIVVLRFLNVDWW